MKRFLLFAVLVVGMSCSQFAWGAEAHLRVFQQDNSVVVPLRYIAEWLGAETRFDAATQQITISLGETTTTLTQGKRRVTVNGVVQESPTAPFELEGVTYVPARVIALAFDAPLRWQEATSEVSITHPTEKTTLTLPCRKDQTWCTALHLDAYAGLVTQAEKRVAAGTPVDVPDEEGRLPLIYATGRGHLDVVRLLVEKGATVNVKGERTPLALAVAPTEHRPGSYLRCREDLPEQEQLALVNYLLDHGAKMQPADLLHGAVKTRRLALVTTLLDRGADIEARDDSEYTPIFVAILERDRPMIDLLLKRKADLKVWDMNKNTLLHSCSGEQTDIMQLLLDAGLDINASNDMGWTPLHAHAGGKDVKAAAFLLQHGAKVNYVPDFWEKYSPLHLAAVSDSVDMVKLLLKAGAKVNAQCHSGWTPLDFALAREDNQAIIDVLRKAGGKPKKALR